MKPGPATEPIIVVDGVEIFLPATSGDGVGTVSPVISYLNALTPDDIDFVEVLSGPEASSYGIKGGHGVILVNTRSSSRENEKDGQKKLKSFLARGFTPPPAFIMPDYSNDKTRAEKFTDLRATLLWNGNKLTDKAGKADLTFYTGDLAAKYDIIVSGITIFGDWFYRRLTIETK
jgi:hypothetical protein